MAKIKVTTSFNDSEEECVQNFEVFILVSKHLGFVQIIRRPKCEDPYRKLPMYTKFKKSPLFH